MSNNIESLKEWTTLAKIHMIRVSCEHLCISVMVEGEMSLQGKDFLPRLEKSITDVNNCLSMITQYTNLIFDKGE